MRKPKRADYIGNRFGMFIVISCVVPSNGTNKGGTWKCKCDCGVEFECKGYSLHWRKSCGHLEKDHNTKLALLNRRPETFTLTRQYKDHKDNAKLKNSNPLLWNDWIRIVKQPCHYCGQIDIRNRATANYYIKRCKTLTNDIIKSYAIKMNGVDRIDSSKGYTLENSVPCCMICNRMKMDSTLTEFLERIILIYKRLIQ